MTWWTGKKHSPEAIAKMSAAKKGKRLSAETRAKISQAHLGRKRPPRSPETLIRMSIAQTGKRHSPESKAKMSLARKGKPKGPFSLEHRANLSAARKKVMSSPEMRAKLSAAAKGRVCSLETRAKRSMAAKRQTGERNPNWRGGTSRHPYAWAFNAELREEIRRRDSYECQLCGASQMECEGQLCVHHIDYDKKNSDPVNLVSLCRSCHSRTVTNRMYWMAFFQNKAISPYLPGEKK